MNAFVFYPLAALTIAATVGVVATRNPVRSALSLVAALLLLAGFFVGLQAHLIAALQVIVYAGAVMVLFLFVITLLNLQPDPNDSPRPYTMELAVGSAVVIAGTLGSVLWGAVLPAGTDAPLPESFGTTVELARQLFSRHLVAFELTSVLLLVAVVGAVVLAKRDDIAPEDGAEG